jgi:glycerol-3-phosphate cytidylyltransferase
MMTWKNRTPVLLQGAFEIINYGHIRAIQRAASEGDYLIIALNTNALLRKYKQREPVLPWQHKKTILQSMRYVDLVVEARTFNTLPLLKRWGVQVYCLTREWESYKAPEIAYMKSIGGRVVFLPRYAGVVPTSEIKRRLLEEAKT